ncbi:hypothetical protein [Alteraurantiacibacter aquimixticola]|uniref:Uncharacterized protein n=1 Tax=Alteraurantiacibacter aquimixticola TaxID=2489173 RepID=A0A4T3EZN2_9SPHN|nr:hypothetical protein [Alteraurantiacibacter aquimixticola]TIX49024.1 hypothetical protein E5222_14950 [Alteraurantiacibacter aquimixticola]
MTGSSSPPEAWKARLARIEKEMELLGRNYPDEKSSRFKQAAQELRRRLVASGLRVHSIFFNPTTLDSPLGTIYLKSDKDLGLVSDHDKELANREADQCIRSAFPDFDIGPAELAWDSYEMIVRDYGGSYDRYFGRL